MIKYHFMMLYKRNNFQRQSLDKEELKDSEKMDELLKKYENIAVQNIKVLFFLLEIFYKFKKEYFIY